MTGQILTAYHLHRALVRCDWHIITTTESTGAVETVVAHGPHEARSLWRRMVRTVDSTSQERRLPMDLAAWATHAATVRGVTFVVRPVVTDRLFPWQRAVLEEHILQAAATVAAGAR